MPLYRVHVKFKKGFEDWHYFNEPTVEEAALRARRFAESTGRKFVAEPASIVDSTLVTVDEQVAMDADKPYAWDLLHSGMTEGQRAAWERDNQEAAAKIAQSLARGDYIPDADRIALARAKRASQIRSQPGNLKHSDAQHVNQRAVLLAPGEEPPHGSR